MSAFKQSMRKLGIRAGLLTGASLAVIAIAGVGASSASAACVGAIEGQGSSLQNVAQTVLWAPEFNLAGCPGGGSTVTYTQSSSGKGMGKWGLNGGAFTTGVSFVGTDDGPTSAQMLEMRKASVGGEAAEMVVDPATQTAIAVVYNPPSGCKMPESAAIAGKPGHITNVNLENAFDGAATNWAAIGAVKTSNPAEACPGTLNLKRVVRKEGSGTTFQFKAYLAKVNTLVHGGTEAITCTGQKKWSELEVIGTEEKPNVTWPECGTIAPEPVEKGGGVARYVAGHEGTIGYAALPDAKNGKKGEEVEPAKVLAVQNNGISESPTYKAPYAESEEVKEQIEEEALCAEAEYTVPVGGRKGESGIDIDWSGVFGGNPTIGGVYPICTLTYHLAWHKYTTAGFGGTVGAAVKSYTTFTLSHLGTAGHRRWYATLPAKTSAGEPHNVKAAAELAISKIE